MLTDMQKVQTKEARHVAGSFHIQLNFNGSNTDGSFTMAVSNSFLSPLEKKSPGSRFSIIKGDFLLLY